jgi:hypothetical protein
LDAEKRRICRTDSRAGQSTSDDMAQAVANQLGETGWNYLWQFLLRVKAKQIEESDCTKLDADFPPDVFQDPAITVGYGEIFPFAPAFFFSIRSQKWLAIDDYCVNPKCDCTEVVLQFAKKDTGKVRALAAMYYNYKARTIQEAKAPTTDQPSLKDLLSSLRSAWSGFEAEAKKRHRKLRILFTRALGKREPLTQTVSLPETPISQASY